MLGKSLYIPTDNHNIEKIFQENNDVKDFPKWQKSSESLKSGDNIHSKIFWTVLK